VAQERGKRSASARDDITSSSPISVKKEKNSKAEAGKAQHRPPIAETVRHELEGFIFATRDVPDQVIYDLSNELLKGLRPGEGLLGNPAEERALYKKPEEAAAAEGIPLVCFHTTNELP
jgi:hypothetical protein